MARWRAYDVIFFDCDSTLSRVEGIDELARLKGRYNEVKRLTAAAMDGEMALSTVYGRRLDLLRPTRAEIRCIARLYRAHVVPDAPALIEALHGLGREVFIVSGGLSPAVEAFGQSLGVARGRIHAVDVIFNRLSGLWWRPLGNREAVNLEEQVLSHGAGPLAETDGKAEIVRELRTAHPGRSLLVGDGVSDLKARSAVDLMVGYGGVVRRDRVAAEADVFIDSESLAPVLPLVASPADVRESSRGSCDRLLAKGLRLVREGAVRFKDRGLRGSLLAAYEGLELPTE